MTQIYESYIFVTKKEPDLALGGLSYPQGCGDAGLISNSTWPSDIFI